MGAYYPTGEYIPAMANPYGVALDDAALRWAAAESAPESVIAAIYLLDTRSVDAIVAKLTPAELEQVIKIVGRSPRRYAPGAYEALKEQRYRRSMQRSAAGTPPAEGPNSPATPIRPRNGSTRLDDTRRPAGPSAAPWSASEHGADVGAHAAPVVHLGAAPELLSPGDLATLKSKLPDALTMRSVPVVDGRSIAIARNYDGITDFLLLDSHRPSDRQIGALGVTHDWTISRRIVELVRTPVILAGGLGPDNVAEAIRVVRPVGVDSKTKTDKTGSHRKDLERVRRFYEAARAVIL
jgi:hypothetical protein